MARPRIGCLFGAVFTSTMFYVYLFSNVVGTENYRNLLEADTESRKLPLNSKYQENPNEFLSFDEKPEIEKNFEIECNVIHIAMVCAGYNSTFSTVTVFKSVLFYRRNPLHFHLIVDEVANRTLFVLFQSWDLPNVEFTYYKSAELVPQVAWIPNTHYSGVYGLLKLVLPEIIDEPKVIVLDTDVTVLTDILGLWRQFDKFTDENVLGLVENQSDWYLKPLANISSPWPALGRGYNTGVILMHLKRLRSIKFRDTWNEISRITLKAITEAHLADQDIINAVIKKYPRTVYRLDCTWNVQLSVNTLSETCYTSTNQINIIHWNSPKKQNVINKHIDDFRKAYQIFVELDGNLLRRQLFVCKKSIPAPTTQQTRLGPCEKFEKSASIKYRTHLFLLEYEYNVVSSPDVTLVTQCSADRLTLLVDLCKRWSGAISVALYFTDADTYNFLKFLKGSEDLNKRRNIAYHVVYKEGEFYPVNYLRNIGMSHVTTSYIFQLDVDFLPSNRLYDTLMSSIVSLRLGEDDKVALIVPAFETERYRFNFPESKEALVKSLNRGVFYTFRYHIWSQGHAATNYTYWCKATEPYEVSWEPDFEPYVVVPSSSPSYDTRFVGFGWNKVSHIAHLAAMGYRYLVLPDGFVIHRPHAASLDIIKFRQDSLYRRCLKKLKDTFVDELLRKYNESAVYNFKKYSQSKSVLIDKDKPFDKKKLKT